MYPLLPSTSSMIELHRPGIEPALQAGTLPKELTIQLKLWVVGASHLTARERQNIEEVLVHNIYITSQYFFYDWTASSGGDRTRVACVTGDTLPKELSRHLILWVSCTPLTRNNTQQHATTHNNTQEHPTTDNNTQQQYTTAHEYIKLPMSRCLRNFGT